jgi:NADH-quinone oxidoreductase subunit E
MDNEKIDEIINRHRGRANALIQALLEIQSQNHWLPREVLDKVSRSLGVPLSEVLHVATFYKTFRLVPQGRHEVHVCMGSSCQVRGSKRVLDAVEKQLGIKPGETDSESKCSLETGNCLGCCNLGPEIVVDEIHHGRITPDGAKEVLKKEK